MQNTIRIQPQRLQESASNLFTAAGTPTHIAEIVAEILVGANLTGHDSHGVLRIPTYLKQIREGSIHPAAEPDIRKKSDGVLTVDGQGGFGHYVAHKAMARGIEVAKEGAVCSLCFQNIGHIGRLGEYAEQAARAGCVGLIYYGIGTHNRGGTVPYGGAEGRLGTNPMAAGLPTGDDTPFVLDMATSVVAEGKLQVARSKGEDLPKGYIVDKDGKPSVKTSDFYEGGHLLPFGGHKGYGLSLLICLLGAISGGSKVDEGMAGGTYMQVINVEAFTTLVDYQHTVRTVLNWMKSTPPAPGTNEVLAPGDFEARTRAQRLAYGIDLPDTIVEQLQQCARELQTSVEL